MSNVTNINFTITHHSQEHDSSDNKSFEPLSFPQWVNKYGEQLCDLYDDFIKETDTCPFEVSILDFEEEMYRESKHFLHTEEIDCNVTQIMKANGGLA